MKDEEIIKALECCAKSKTNGDCEALNCPCFKDRMCIFVDDDYGLQNLALDLINRQKAEIEKLRQAFETTVVERDMIQAQKDFECQKAVNKFAKELKYYYFRENGGCSLSYVRTVIDALLKDWLWR